VLCFEKEGEFSPTKALILFPQKFDGEFVLETFLETILEKMLGFRNDETKFQRLSQLFKEFTSRSDLIPEINWFGRRR
jgi:hypothetical protein